MPNLIIIVVGLIFALLGYKKAWYASWAFLFNVLIAVYVSIMITPQIVDQFEVIRDYLHSYSYAAFALVVAAVILVIMNFLSSRYFTVAAAVTFPKILDSAGAAVLGFLTGAVITGFLLYLITITPLYSFSAVRTFTQSKQTSGCANCAVIAACDVVHEISLQPIPDAVAKQLEGLMDGWKQSVKEANSPSDSNSVETPQAPASDVPDKADKSIIQRAIDRKQMLEMKDTNNPSDSNLR